MKSPNGRQLLSDKNPAQLICHLFSKRVYLTTKTPFSKIGMLLFGSYHGMLLYFFDQNSRYYLAFTLYRMQWCGAKEGKSEYRAKPQEKGDLFLDFFNWPSSCCRILRNKLDRLRRCLLLKPFRSIRRR